MATTDATYVVELGFTAESQVYPDPDRPPLLRARPQASTPYDSDGTAIRACDAIDWKHDGSVHPDLFTFGFDRVDLTGLDAVQGACQEINETGTISDRAAATLRGALLNATLQSSSGRTLTVLHVADEGLIMRTAGPNRLPVVGPRSKGMNGHGPATSVHADQDVHGTPLVQLMDGKAPSLFRHDSPDGSNHDASLMLVNLWIPIHQISQPLVLGDSRSIDRPRHQLRFGLTTETFLNREDELTVNDIWVFLPGRDQRWYFRSEMDHREAYVFNTLSTPHGAAVLPGEEIAERCYLALQAAEAAIENGEPTTAEDPVSKVDSPEVSDQAPPALRAAISRMRGLLDEATNRHPMTASETKTWLEESRAARRRVVRRSVELRLVVSTGA